MSLRHELSRTLGGRGLAILAVLTALALFAAGLDAPSAGAATGEPRLVSILTPHDQGLVGSRSVQVRVRVSSKATHFDAYLGTERVTARFGAARGGVRSATLRVPSGVNRLYVRARAGGAEERDNAKFVVARRSSGIIGLRGGLRASQGAKLSLPRDPSYLVAWLNGHRLKRPVESIATDGLDADDGVRHGTNRLTITAATANGHSYGSIARKFSVPLDRPIAGANSGELGRIGLPSTLDARASRTARRGAQPQYRWRILSAPAGSKAKLENADSARPRLIPDRNGHYTLQVRVTEPGKQVASYDSTIVPIAPLIDPIGWRLQTIPSGGGGIRLNGSVPSAGGTSASGGNWVQLLVLDNMTLEVKTARSFNTSDASALSKALKPLGESDLVVLTGAGHKTTLSSSQVAVLRAAWKQLGGTLAPFKKTKKPSQDPGFGSGQWSITGRPGYPSGAADQSYAIAAGADQAPGGLGGLLEKDAHNVYTLVPDQYVPFDTVASGSPAQTNTISVGAQKYQSTALPGAGFHLLVLDSGTLAKVFEQTYATQDSNGKADVAGIKALAKQLSTYPSQGRQVLIVLQSIGKPRPLENTWPHTLTSAVSSIGGTTDVFNNLDGSGGYTLVGGTYTPDRYGDEVSQPMTKKPARIIGLFSRNSRGQMESNYASPIGGYDRSIFEVAYGPTQTFPDWDSAGEQLAYTRISQKFSQSMKDGNDIRRNYWLETGDNGFWGTALTNLGFIRIEDMPPGVTPDDLTAVQGQLVKEFTWVSNIRGWITSLRNIYEDANSSSPFQLHNHTQSLLTNLGASGGNETSSKVIGSLSETLFVSSYFLEAAAPEIGTVAGAFGIAAEMSSTDDGDPVSASIEAKASDLGEELEDTFTSTSRGLARLGDILVSDPAKLQAAGIAAPKQWSFDTDSTNSAGDALRRTTDRTIWKALMPIAFHNDILIPTDINTNPVHAPNYRCDDGKDNTPYEDEPASGWEKVLTDFKGSKRQYRLHAFGSYGHSPKSTSGDFRVPKASITDNLFSTNPENNQSAGFFKLEFFNRYMTSRNISCSYSNQ